MNLRIIFSAVLICFSGFFPASASAQPVKIILDTDIDSDADDVGAMAMLHTLADHKVVDILGIIVTTEDKYAPMCADAINHYFKRPDIPIGILKELPLGERSKYTRQLSEEFEHRLKSPQDAENATTLYRRLLASQPDSSVIIVTLGHLTSLRHLLESLPDKYSHLPGVELVRKKVKLWSCMGGQFPEGKEANFFRPDPQSTITCLDKYPGQIVFSGWEVGNKIITGGAYLEKSLPEKDPVRRAYQLYNNWKGRQSWDQTSILFAVSPGYWSLNRNGKCVVQKDGSNKWIEGPENPKQAYLVEKVDPVEIAKVLDALMTGVFRPGFIK